MNFNIIWDFIGGIVLMCWFWPVAAGEWLARVRIFYEKHYVHLKDEEYEKIKATNQG